MMPADGKANNGETSAGVRKDSAFKSRLVEKMGDSCHKDHLNISVQAGVYMTRGKEGRRKET